MKLSVIVPVYNAESFLERCVDSILNQTVEDLEVILINDGSTDESQKLIDAYTKRFPERVRAVAVENGGQGRARNIGIEMAKGEYFGFVDSDDWIAPDMYEKLIEAAEEQAADIALCDLTAVFADESTRYEKQMPNERVISAAGSASNKVFAAKLVGEVRFPQGVWYEDFAFSAKLLALAGKVAYVREPLYFYRCGHSSTMHNQNSRKNLDIITVMEELGRFMTDIGQRDDFEYLLLNHVLLDSINRVNAQHAKDKKEILSTLRDYVRGYIPSLSDCNAFKAETRNRKIIMRLNYHGLYGLSALLLKIKKSI